MNRYPLSWPAGWARMASPKEARFGRRVTSGSSWPQTKALSINDGVQRVLTVLDRMGIDSDDIVISTNVPTRLDGLPKSGAGEPADHGVAVYWRERSGRDRVMAIDRYDRVADNLAAIAATLEAMRAIERHGGAEILDRAFTGFAALPSGRPALSGWQQVLGVHRTVEQAEAEYRRLAQNAHPDAGGTDEAMATLNVAIADARRELS